MDSKTRQLLSDIDDLLTDFIAYMNDPALHSVSFDLADRIESISTRIENALDDDNKDSKE